MAEKKVEAFMKAVEEDRSLRAAVGSAVMAAVVEVAVDRGFDFTLEEYVGASRELDDHELDAVAGGVGSEPTPIYRGTLSRLNNIFERQGFEDPLTAFEDPLTAIRRP